MRREIERHVAQAGFEQACIALNVFDLWLDLAAGTVVIQHVLGAESEQQLPLEEFLRRVS